MTPEERAAIRRTAAARARAMGYRQGAPDPGPDGPGDPAPVPLPDVSPRVLRALLDHDQLTGAQADRARHVLAAAARFAREWPAPDPDTADGGRLLLQHGYVPPEHTDRARRLLGLDDAA